MSRSLSDDERIWWSVLVDAEMYMEMHNKDGEGEEALLNHDVSCEARRELVTRFGVNLDSIAPRARAVYLRLLDEHKAKKKTEEAKMTQIQRIFDQIFILEVMNA